MQTIGRTLMYNNRNAAVFLDRDGTIIEDRGILKETSQVVFFPGTFKALQKLQEHYSLFIVTNQSGVAEGTISLDDVKKVNGEVVESLAKSEIYITDVYVCPHHRRDNCSCIKPNPFFLQEAAKKHGVDLGRSFTIGDHPHDVEFARNTGAQGIYVLTGHGSKHLGQLPPNTVVVKDIQEAADRILKHGPRKNLTQEPLSVVRRAARFIRESGVVAFPTETVYGLGANAFDPKAVARIFEIKRRPRFDPLIVHAASLGMVEELAIKFPSEARRLARHFWPGPLTMVLLKTEVVPGIVTSGLPAVAVRIPAHPLARELITLSGVPIAAPSANLFGRVSPTCAGHVEQQLGGQMDLILDGGPCRIGIESTIISFAGEQPLILRMGGLPVEEIRAVLGPVRIDGRTESRPLAPGRLPRHYATRTPLVIWDGVSPPPEGVRVGLLTFKPMPGSGSFAAAETLSESGDMTEAAANLFAALHRLDNLDLNLIAAVPVPNQGLGRAVNDRLYRAGGSVAESLPVRM